VASVIFALGIAWAPVVVLVSAVSGVPAAAVDLTAVDVPGVPAVARVFAVLPSLLLLISLLLLFQGFCVLDVVGVSAVLGIPSVAGVNLKIVTPILVLLVKPK